MKNYKSHKVVRAAKILAAEKLENGDWNIAFDGGNESVGQNVATRFHMTERDLGYYVEYPDGYVSWSPSKAFEEGYTEIPANPLKLTPDEIDTVLALRDGAARVIASPMHDVPPPSDEA